MWGFCLTNIAHLHQNRLLHRQIYHCVYQENFFPFISIWIFNGHRFVLKKLIFFMHKIPSTALFILYTYIYFSLFQFSKIIHNNKKVRTAIKCIWWCTKVLINIVNYTDGATFLVSDAPNFYLIIYYYKLNRFFYLLFFNPHENYELKFLCGSKDNFSVTFFHNMQFKFHKILV